LAVQSLTAARRPTRLLSFSAFLLLLAAVARNSLMPHLKSPLWMALQPIGALLLLAGIINDMRDQGDSPEAGCDKGE
jgi:hypothetical protein